MHNLLSHIQNVCQDSEYVVAVRNYINEDRALLNFHKGDIIRLQHVDGLEAGEMCDAVCLCCFTPNAAVCHNVCVSVHPSALRSGKHYGCIVRKKVMLLEELKRDTSEFGGFDRTAVSVCV